MRVVCLYREQRDYSRIVREWLADFARITGKEIEVMDPDTRAGQGLMQAYDLMQFPVLIAIDGQGRLVEKWAGLPLPQFDTVAYYAN